MNNPALAAFLAAYTCSGLAGLIYEVSWTRLLTLHIGHTTAAASAVVSAFMGGLALGAAVAGRLAGRLTLRRCLYAYAILEASVAAIALLLPAELRAATPLLQRAYRDGAPGLIFPAVRLAACFLLILAPGGGSWRDVHYFEAVLRFLRGDAEGTVASAGRAIAADRAYAPTYDLLGAAHTKLGQSAAARDAFETSLRFNAHDSTAYTNLGVLALTDGNRAVAAGYFAEALWLDPESRTARQGLAQAQAGS